MWQGDLLPWVSGTMLLLTLALGAAFVTARRRASRASGAPADEVRANTARSAFGVTAWVAAFSAAALSGALTRFDLRPPPINLMMLAVFAGAFALARSRAGTEIVDRTPLAALVGFQAFRLPLELAMHEAARAGVMPSQMTFTGCNFDIVTGASAIVVAWLVHRGLAPRALVVAWNALGAALLANVLVVAVASTPLFHAFGPHALNTWIAYFPWVLLPSVMVPAAIVGHVLVARWLLRHPAPRAVAA